MHCQYNPVFQSKLEAGPGGYVSTQENEIRSFKGAKCQKHYVLTMISSLGPIFSLFSYTISLIHISFFVPCNAFGQDSILSDIKMALPVSLC